MVQNYNSGLLTALGSNCTAVYFVNIEKHTSYLLGLLSLTTGHCGFGRRLRAEGRVDGRAAALQLLD